MTGSHAESMSEATAGNAAGAPRKRHVFETIADVVSDLMFLCAIVAGAFLLWQTFWTGVESSKTQTQQLESSGWSAPAVDSDGSVKIAGPQAGDPPTLRDPAYGDLIGQLSIPRFGAKWQRNLVQGTDNTQLARHGLGHYQGSSMPGGVGLYAVAGHRAGYGEPLAYIDTLEKGDAIVTRTADYWFVYEYTDHRVVSKDDNEAIASVPFHPEATPTERLMALSSCEPRYYMGGGETPYRWVAYAKLKYWAKTSDGTPRELVEASDANGSTTFSIGSGPVVDSVAGTLPDLPTLLKTTAIAYVMVYISAAVAWGWPGLSRWFDERDSGSRKSRTGLLSWSWRLQPGPLPLRILLYAAIIVMFLCVMFQWACPWAATDIPWLASGSNYATIS